MIIHRIHTSAESRLATAVSQNRRLRKTNRRVVSRPRLECLEARTLLSIFVVNNTADSGPGSLREAILDSNAATGARNTINFAISGWGVHTIASESALPAITT